MLNKIALSISLSVFVIFAAGYGTGHYMASSRAERDIAAIRSMMEEEKAERLRQEEIQLRMEDEEMKKITEMNKAILDAPYKSY